MHTFLIRVRTWFAFIIDPLGKFFAKQTYRREFGSQRMCPFCGLITSRSKSSCLECGKSLQSTQLHIKKDEV